MFIALRWMQEPERVMVGLAENIQACLRIFRRAQHLWLVRDILHLPQGVFIVFVLWHTEPIRSIRLIRGRKEIRRTGVYLCLSPCDGCIDPGGVMVWVAEKYPSLLEDFLAAAPSMARKRHLASSARGFYCFLSYGTDTGSKGSRGSTPSYPW